MSIKKGFMKVSVKSYSGYKANEKPRSFTFKDKEYQVKEILDSWFGPDYTYFKLKADDENIYILKYNEKRDEWKLSFYKKS